MSERNKKVWKLWLRMPQITSKNVGLWEKFNAVMLRKFGPPD
jgi:hypothetical protein